jgi:hypothetical protein
MRRVKTNIYTLGGVGFHGGVGIREQRQKQGRRIGFQGGGGIREQRQKQGRRISWRRGDKKAKTETRA